jgi:hypothetical protein
MKKRTTVTVAQMQERFDELLAQAGREDTELVIEFAGRAFKLEPVPQDEPPN